MAKQVTAVCFCALWWSCLLVVAERPRDIPTECANLPARSGEASDRSVFEPVLVPGDGAGKASLVVDPTCASCEVTLCQCLDLGKLRAIPVTSNTTTTTNDTHAGSASASSNDSPTAPQLLNVCSNSWALGTGASDASCLGDCAAEYVSCKLRTAKMIVDEQAAESSTASASCIRWAHVARIASLEAAALSGGGADATRAFNETRLWGDCAKAGCAIASAAAQGAPKRSPHLCAAPGTSTVHDSDVVNPRALCVRDALWWNQPGWWNNSSGNHTGNSTPSSAPPTPTPPTPTSATPSPPTPTPTPPDSAAPPTPQPTSPPQPPPTPSPTTSTPISPATPPPATTALLTANEALIAVNFTAFARAARAVPAFRALFEAASVSLAGTNASSDGSGSDSVVTDTQRLFDVVTFPRFRTTALRVFGWVLGNASTAARRVSIDALASARVSPDGFVSALTQVRNLLLAASEDRPLAPLPNASFSTVDWTVLLSPTSPMTGDVVVMLARASVLRFPPSSVVDAAVVVTLVTKLQAVGSDRPAVLDRFGVVSAVSPPSGPAPADGTTRVPVSNPSLTRPDPPTSLWPTQFLAAPRIPIELLPDTAGQGSDSVPAWVFAVALIGSVIAGGVIGAGTMRFLCAVPPAEPLRDRLLQLPEI